MFCIRSSHIENFQNDHKIISKTKYFIFRLQELELRLDKVRVPKTENNKYALLNESIKVIKEYLEKILGEKYNVFQTHCSYLKKNIVNSRDASEKKEILKKEIHYLKSYINTKGGVHWDEANHTDILYIYWYSKTDLEIIEKITACLGFLDKEIIKLENKSHMK